MTIKLRRDTYAAWASVNPVLPDGQPSYDTTNQELRIGNGTSPWLSLPAIGGGGGSDHGGLSGLLDDDHTQYHNDTRGDLRYLRKINNAVVVNQESDFPVQDATTITLSANKAFIIGAYISTTKRFIIESGATLTSMSIFAPSLQYTGTGVMFTCSGLITISDLTYDCPNGTVFGYTGPGILLLLNTLCQSCKNIGSITSSGATASFNWKNNSFQDVTGQGLETFGDFFVQSIGEMFINAINTTLGAAYRGINLGTATFVGLELTDVEQFGVVGSIGLSGLTNSGNLVANSIATVQNCNFITGGMTPLAGITDADIRWKFEGNAGIEDTIDDALIYFTGNATNTVIAASSTNGSNAVKVAGVWTTIRVSKFSADATGKLTSLSEKSSTAPVDVSLQLKSVGGGAIVVKVYLFKNGVLIPGAATVADVSGSVSKNLSIPWQITFNQNDYIEIFVENQTNATDILVEDAIFRIR